MGWQNQPHLILKSPNPDRKYNNMESNNQMTNMINTVPQEIDGVTIRVATNILNHYPDHAAIQRL